jgi:quercetin dioxygenase-like cupin family protein
MNAMNLLDAARAAMPARPDRPATSIVVDEPAARVILFRLAPGQTVPLHKNASVVMLTVLQGAGTILSQPDNAAIEHRCRTGDLFVFGSGERHGMRADGEELVLLATITPRPGGS